MWATAGAEEDDAAKLPVDPGSPAVRAGGLGQGFGLLTVPGGRG